MANVEMRCPHCGQTYALTPEQAPQYVGQTITCTKCQRPFVAHVPGYGAPAVPAAPGMPPGPPPPGVAPIGYSGPQYGQPQQQGNGLAVASLVIGILGFCLPIGFIAIVLGALGMKKTRDPRVGGKGMAIAGLVLGIVSTMFVLLQVSILLPALNRAREQGNRVKCASNLRQIGLAVQMYANSNKGNFPPDLPTLVKSQGVGGNTLVCPSTNQTPASGTPSFQLGKDLSYVYVGKGRNFTAQSDVVIAYEPPSDHTPGLTGAGSGGNVLFADGHVEFLPNLDSVISELNTGHNPPRPVGQRTPGSPTGPPSPPSNPPPSDQ
jgi:prepilin-type processing-associated H-X9-DG protein